MPFMIATSTRERKFLESKARRAAQAAGYSIHKSKVRPGGYRLIERGRNLVIAGDRFTLSAEDVLRIIGEIGARLADRDDARRKGT
jgi:hypothetical protein